MISTNNARRKRFSDRLVGSEEHKSGLQGLSIQPIDEPGRRKARKKLFSLPIVHKELNKEDRYNVNEEYEVGDLLGFGTYSQVKSAVQISTGQTVAIKIWRGQTSTALLQREKEIIESLNWEFAPKVLDFKIDKLWNRAYLIMEKIDGWTLDVFVEQNTVSQDVIVSFIYQLWTMVQALHEQKVCHRDIKPQNLIVSKDLRLRLIDFNISKVWNDETKEVKAETPLFLTQASTPIFAAPEVFQGNGYDQSVDMWGIGMMIFVLCGGVVDESFNKHADNSLIYEAQKEFIKSREFLWDQIKDFILHWLEEDPKQRTKSSDSLFASTLEYCSEFLASVRSEECKSWE